MYNGNTMTERKIVPIIMCRYYTYYVCVRN